MLRTAPHSHTINMWHRHLAHLNHQDLKQLLESSGERITDPIKPSVKPISDSIDVQLFADSAVEPVADPDIKPIADPMDVELVTDSMDVEPVTDLMDVEQIADPDVEPVTDSIDVEQIADPDVEPVNDRMDTSPRWETPGLCWTCILSRRPNHMPPDHAGSHAEPHVAAPDHGGGGT